MKVKLTESQLHRIVTETVRKVVNEIGETPKGQYALGQLSARNHGRFIKAERELKDRESDGWYDDYDAKFKEVEKYGKKLHSAPDFASVKRKQAGSFGEKERFKTKDTAKLYSDAMGDAFEQGYTNYYRKNKDLWGEE